jgi:hypothetical protein
MHDLKSKLGNLTMLPSTTQAVGELITVTSRFAVPLSVHQACQAQHRRHRRAHRLQRKELRDVPLRVETPVS